MNITPEQAKAMLAKRVKTINLYHKRCTVGCGCQCLVEVELINDLHTAYIDMASENERLLNLLHSPICKMPLKDSLIKEALSEANHE